MFARDCARLSTPTATFSSKLHGVPITTEGPWKTLLLDCGTSPPRAAAAVVLVLVCISACSSARTTYPLACWVVLCTCLIVY